MDKKLILAICLVGLVLVSGCTNPFRPDYECCDAVAIDCYNFCEEYYNKTELQSSGNLSPDGHELMELFNKQDNCHWECYCKTAIEFCNERCAEGYERGYFDQDTFVFDVILGSGDYERDDDFDIRNPETWRFEK